MAVAVPAAASASTAASPVVGHVYVNDNTAGANTIRAFDRHADGRLTPQAGSPFAAGSTVALPDGSQPGDVPFNGTGTKLVGTRVGTSLIDSFTVGRDGGLGRARIAVLRARAWPVRQRVPAD
jgi:hypothetical protein